MLAHYKGMLEYNKGQVAIHPRFNKLITALHTAVENGEGKLYKEATSLDDLFDVFRLSLTSSTVEPNKMSNWSPHRLRWHNIWTCRCLH